MREYKLTEDEAALAFSVVSDHCKALHNWIASAVECNEIDRAKDLTRVLRSYQKIFAKLNVEAHKTLDAMRGGQQ